MSFRRLCVLVAVLFATAECGNIIFPSNNKVTKNHGNETPTATAVGNNEPTTAQHLSPQQPPSLPPPLPLDITSTIYHMQQYSTTHQYSYVPQPAIQSSDNITIQRIQYTTVVTSQSTVIQNSPVTTTYVDDSVAKKQVGHTLVR